MKRIIRGGVFETNSSSSHSLTLTDLETFEKWKNGELLFDNYGGKFYTKEEAIEKLKKDGVNVDSKNEEDDYEWCEECDCPLEECDCQPDIFRDNDLFSYSDYEEYVNEYSEDVFEEIHTTPGGEKVIAFGHYSGFNG